jgi:hypothetical protein
MDEIPSAAERLRALLRDHAASTGEYISESCRVLEVVPLLQDPSPDRPDAGNIAAWVLIDDNNTAKLLIEGPVDRTHPVDVVLERMGAYNAAHERLKQLLIRATKHNRAENAKRTLTADSSGEPNEDSETDRTSAAPGESIDPQSELRRPIAAMNEWPAGACVGIPPNAVDKDFVPYSDDELVIYDQVDMSVLDGMTRGPKRKPAAGGDDSADG